MDINLKARAGWILLLLYSLQLASCTEPENAFMNITLVRFSNPQGINTNGLSCDSDTPCDTIIALCVEKPLNVDHPTCGIGRLRSGAWQDQNDIEHVAMGSLDFRIEQPSDLDVRLHIDVTDDDVEIGGDDVIDKWLHEVTLSLADGGGAEGRETDMHVEGEVTVMLRSEAHVIELRIAAGCMSHWYGELCERYCIPRDNPYGHYTCNTTTGHKICLPGFTGVGCTDPTEEAASGTTADDPHTTAAPQTTALPHSDDVTSTESWWGWWSNANEPDSVEYLGEGETPMYSSGEEYTEYENVYYTDEYVDGEDSTEEPGSVNAAQVADNTESSINELPDMQAIDKYTALVFRGDLFNEDYIAIRTTIISICVDRYDVVASSVYVDYLVSSCHGTNQSLPMISTYMYRVYISSEYIPGDDILDVLLSRPVLADVPYELNDTCKMFPPRPVQSADGSSIYVAVITCLFVVLCATVAIGVALKRKKQKSEPEPAVHRADRPISETFNRVSLYSNSGVQFAVIDDRYRPKSVSSVTESPPPISPRHHAYEPLTTAAAAGNEGTPMSARSNIVFFGGDFEDIKM